MSTPAKKTGPSAAAASGATAFSAAAFAQMLKRNWLVMALTAIVTFGAVATWTYFQTPIYASGAIVAIDTQRTGGDPIGNILNMRETRTLANEIETLRQSLGIGERVAERLLERYSAQELIKDEATQERLEAMMRNPETDVNQAVAIGMQQLGFVTIAPLNPQVDMIRIGAKHHNRRVARDMAQFYAEEYREYARAKSAAGREAASEFLEDQVASKRAQLRALDREITVFKEREGFVALDTEAETAVQRSTELGIAISDADVERQTAQIRLNALNSQLAAVTPSLVSATASGTQREIDALKDKITGFETTLSSYYANNPALLQDPSGVPEVVQLQRQIQQARQQIQVLSEQLVEESLSLADISLDGDAMAGLAVKKQEALGLELDISRLQLQAAALSAQQARNDQRLRELPSQQATLASLERDLAVATESFLILQEKYNDARTQAQSEVSYVELLRVALTPAAPMSPNIPQNLLLGAMLGLVLAFGLALLRHATDHRIRVPEDVKNHGFSLLGTIPDLRGLVKKHFNGQPFVNVEGREVSSLVVAAMHPLSSVTEAFRHLRTSVQYSLPDSKLEAIMVSSPGPGEGKSTTAVNLAIALAQAGKRTLYIDADLRRPTGHRLLGVNRDRGLAELLFQDAPIDWENYRRALHIDWGRFDNHLDNLYVLPAGQVVPDPAELLGSHKMEQLLEAARQEFDVVILDTSPILAVTDAVLLATYCDATLLVARAEETSWRSLQRAKELLETTGDAGAPVIGAVLNSMKESGEAYGYGYGYGYKYGDSYGGRSADFADFMKLQGGVSGDGAGTSVPTLSKKESSADA
ncbi:MAG: polysaccharide biosynthesis tyrosine autokinase [Bacteroidota bacterium]